ncbi:MAG: chromosomal replication initiator protein DnaA [Metamycoplasmataceae bacterium]
MDMNTNTNQLYTKNFLLEFEKALDDHVTFSNFILGVKVKVTNQNLIYVVFSSNESLNYIKSKYPKIIKTINEKIFTNEAKIIYIDKNGYQNLSLSDTKNTKNDLIKKSKIKTDLTFDNYINANFNAEAIKAAKKIIESDKVIFSPLFIYSDSGLGKTHLMHAIGNDLIEKNKKVCYIAADLFMKKLVLHLMDSNQEKINKIADLYNDFDVLIFDDIQTYAGKNSTLAVLFNIINHHISENKQIIITSDKKPRLLGGFEERFITRFQGGLTIEIKNPSYDDLMKILKVKLLKENIDPSKWEDEALKFIVKNHSNSIRNLEGAINRVKFYEEEIENIKYTQQVIGKIFSSLKQQKENITKERIVDVVAKYYGLSRTDLQNKSRRKDIVLGRHIAMWLIRDILDVTYKEIGIFFKNRDHSTVLAAIEKIDSQMKMNDVIKSALKKLRQKIESIT